MQVGSLKWYHIFLGGWWWWRDVSGSQWSVRWGVQETNENNQALDCSQYQQKMRLLSKQVSRWSSCHTFELFLELNICVKLNGNKTLFLLLFALLLHSNTTSKVTQKLLKKVPVLKFYISSYLLSASSFSSMVGPCAGSVSGLNEFRLTDLKLSDSDVAMASKVSASAVIAFNFADSISIWRTRSLIASNSLKTKKIQI